MVVWNAIENRDNFGECGRKSRNGECERIEKVEGREVVAGHEGEGGERGEICCHCTDRNVSVTKV